MFECQNNTPINRVLCFQPITCVWVVAVRLHDIFRLLVSLSHSPAHIESLTLASLYLVL